MPSIEIVAVQQQRPIDVAGFPFAVLTETKMKSHRSPSRFQSHFETLEGILYHLGNPDLKADHEGRCFFAYELLSPESVEATFLEFAAEYRPYLEKFIGEVIRDSPTHQLIFTSDWQFGPEWTKHEPRLILDEFWRQHDLRRISLNALYPIVSG
jgi:hypothetical protein